MADRKAYPSNVISSSLHSDAKKPSFSTTEAADPLWVPIPCPAFHESMVNFENMPRDEDNEDYDGCRVLQMSAKKRRLSPCQVQFLERSFDEENRLQPERKAQLAEELGLQPRQVAIWFQNRRAQFKTKQLEKEYSQLKDGYDKLKEQCDCLVKEKEQLKEELLLLKNKLLGWKEKQNSSDPLEPVNSGNISGDQKSNVIIAKQLQDQKPMSGCKNEEETSAYRSSGVLDSGSPYFMDSNNQVLQLEPANTLHALEADCSDFSQEEGDCVFGFTEDWDQHLWSWPC